jgi:hypothetical protein
MSNRLRLGAACAALAFHLPLLLPLLLPPSAPPRHAPRLQPPDAVQDRPLTVRLIPLMTVDPEPADPGQARSPRLRVDTRTAPALARSPEQISQPITLPLTQGLTLPSAQAINPPPDLPVAPQAAASARTPRTLDLKLPPRTLRGEAAAPLPPSARPRSVEATLERALGNSPLIEENLGNGRLRLRRGRDCVELRDSRMAQVDPFNQSVSPIPKQAEDCSR